MSRVVVFGASGRTGRLIVEESLRAGHTVTAAVRTPETFSPALGEGSLKVVRADVRDAGSLRAAVRGQDAVVSAVGPSGRHAHGLYSGAARALVGAMEAAGVSRVLALSSAGVRHDDPAFALWYRLAARTLLRELYDDLRLMEEIVGGSALDWTFVRPTRLLDGPPTGTYRVQDGSTPPGGWQVTRRDVARFVAQELEGRRWSHAAPTLAQ